MGGPHTTNAHRVLSDVGCMSLPGTDPRPALRAAQRCGATPIFWAAPHPMAAEHLASVGPEVVDRLVVWADAPPVAPLPGHVSAVIASPELLDSFPRDEAGVTRIPAITSVGQLDDAMATLHDAPGGGHLVLVGSEAAGPVGDTSSFILLQQVLRAIDGNARPAPAIWVRGGIGPNTAAAAIAGGAAGVILDTQTSLLRESTVPAATRRILAAADGSETKVISGCRVLVRPDLPTAGCTQLPAGNELGFDDPASQPIPAGQDLPVASTLATIGVTVAGAVQAIRRSMYADVGAAAELASLRPDGPLAQRTGSTYPVFQGPMTRVSDTPAFTEAVADAGGNPFLALALLRGSEVERLLADTAERLGDRPWGVGILGFVPPELRSEQLEVVKAYRPPLAIIAGGRPSQARELEAGGTRTYLHVPSPGLLRQFLADGARRFIFEGRECGGHVGPRSSFSLWQAQLDVLAGHANASELEVIVAGGIHDERSVAMVAAMAQPLAARGAAIGVLAGTAYLLTEEIVRSGAIVEGFQRAALECAATALVETAPGHATRCVASPFVDAFERRRQELLDAEVPASDRWAELETLNLGRLRLASKGLERTDAGLTQVDEAAQREGGMFMIGDAATMADEPLTLATLHHRMSSGAMDHLAQRADELVAARLLPGADVDAADQPDGPDPLDIAVIGMECVFPGAENVARFWTNTVMGRNTVTEVPTSRWETARHFDPTASPANAGKLTPSKWGGFVPPIDFDALAYGIPPASLAAIEPVQLLSLEVAARALRDAGYEHRHFDRSRTSVIFGAEAGTDLSSTYGFRSTWPSLLGDLPAELEEFLPTLSEDSFPGLLTNVISGRIANRLDLGGANYTVDAACASSLTALDAACKELTAGTSDLVLCGGADLHNGINDYLLFSSVHALSPTGQCRTFSADADGIALGEGVACVVLKRLEDARRDGDRIHAVIKAVAASSDGRHLGLTAPRQLGQVRCLERAYQQGGVNPADVGLMEAHGTGTVVGDRTELATLTELFSGAGAGVGATALGSVKSQIGHTKCAAGLAGFIRVVRAVSTGVRPPTGNITAPNDYWDPATSPFRLDSAATPWLDEHRTAAVSGFGFGGTNFHAIIESADDEPPPAHGLDAWPAELFVFTGSGWPAAQVLIEQLLGYLDHHGASSAPLRDLAATVWSRRSGDVHVCVVAEDHADLRARLNDIVGHGPPENAADTPSSPGADAVHWAQPLAEGERVAFVYPGQGSQRPGMLGDLFVAFPQLRAALRDGGRWANELFPPTAYDAETRAAQVAALTDTRVAQPALGIAGMTLTRLLDQLGVQPDMAAGHSYGELVALWAAGALPTEGFLDLSAARGEAMVAAAEGDGGSMAALALGAERAEAIIEQLGRSTSQVGADGVVVANRNAPQQSVVSGPTATVEAVVEEVTRLGERATMLNVACAFHSPVVAAAATAFAERLADVECARPRFDVYSNVTAGRFENAGDVAGLLAEQVAAPVRFTEEVEAMYAAGARLFIEVGPGRVLGRLIGLTLGDRPHRTVCCDVAGEPGLTTLLGAVGRMAAAGLPVDLDPFFDGRSAAVDLAARDPLPGWTVDGHLVRGRDGLPVTGGLRPAHDFVEAHPMGLPVAGQPGGQEGGGADAALVQYLQGMRELVSAQRDVMMSYLGVAVAPGSPVIDAAIAGAGATLPQAALGSSHNGSGPADGTAIAADAGAPPVLDAPQLEAVVTAIVAERTGYPPDMLDPDLDLEADLSIDSIKRIEILGELAERASLPGAEEGTVDESVVEGLSMIKTIRGIVTWIVEQADEDAPTPQPADDGPHSPGGVVDLSDNGALAASGDRTAPGHAGPGADHVDSAHSDAPLDVPGKALCLRPVVVATEAPLAPESVRGLTVWITGGPTATAVGDAVTAEGGIAVVFDRADEPPSEDPQVFIDTSGLDEAVGTDGTDGPAAAVGAIGSYPALRQALLRNARFVVMATGDGGSFGIGTDGDEAGGDTAGGRAAGFRGMLRAAATEYPDVGIRCVDLDPAEGSADAARHLLEEVAAPDPALCVVGRSGAGRRTIRWERFEPDGPDATVRGGASLPVGPGRPVLLSGGARGITAKVAVGLAQRFGCPVALLGRSPHPTADPSPELNGAPDDRELRRRLIDGGLTTPRDIEARLAELTAEAEIRQTLDSLAGLGVEVRYLQADVTDPAAIDAAMTAVADSLGPVGLVVHGAGVLADHLIRDKEPSEFQRVWHTKVDGALALHRHAPADAGLVLFASISGAVGNQGQVDYGAANDALDTLAHSIADRTVAAIDWGPWAGGGMVSPELEREYERRGIGLVAPDAGVALVCQQVEEGLPHRQLMLVRAEPATIGAIEVTPVHGDSADEAPVIGSATNGAVAPVGDRA
ncbi:MAG: SDR family NAD(P)-dependent oxidoreductase [Microthrixaceae bacterium]